MARGPQPGPDRANEARGEITPDLVREIADKVYAMLLMDVKLESERRRTPGSGPLHVGGGW
jgi:hypothetical protein